eukprot:172690_1
MSERVEKVGRTPLWLKITTFLIFVLVALILVCMYGSRISPDMENESNHTTIEPISSDVSQPLTNDNVSSETIEATENVDSHDNLPIGIESSSIEADYDAIQHETLKTDLCNLQIVNELIEQDIDNLAKSSNLLKLVAARLKLPRVSTKIGDINHQQTVKQKSRKHLKRSPKTKRRSSHKKNNKSTRNKRRSEQRANKKKRTKNRGRKNNTKKILNENNSANIVLSMSVIPGLKPESLKDFHGLLKNNRSNEEFVVNMYHKKHPKFVAYKCAIECNIFSDEKITTIVFTLSSLSRWDDLPAIRWNIPKSLHNSSALSWKMNFRNYPEPLKLYGAMENFMAQAQEITLDTRGTRVYLKSTTTGFQEGSIRNGITIGFVPDEKAMAIFLTFDPIE